MKSTDFQATVVLASIPRYAYADRPIISIQLRYPRIIHSELMTHRCFSRNARSSRAVPVKNLLNEEIYVPHFLKNKSGMQADEQFSPEELKELQRDWTEFARQTQRFSQNLSDRSVHKQWANRPLEWFGYIDTLVTATNWANWEGLRNHEAAQPEIKELAKVITTAIDGCSFHVLGENEWHLPYVLRSEYNDLPLDDLKKISVARCARVSYAPFDGNASYEKEFQRYELLRNAVPFHASPFEHQAQFVFGDGPFDRNGGIEYIPSNLSRPWLQYRKVLEVEIRQDWEAVFNHGDSGFTEEEKNKIRKQINYQ